MRLVAKPSARSACRWLAYFAATALLTIAAFAGCSMKKPNASELFQWQQLEAAGAIANGNMEQLRAAVRGVEIDKPGKKEMTLLWFAIMEKNFDEIRLLVQCGSKPDQQVAEGLGIPVDYALRSKDLCFLNAMLVGGMSANTVADNAHRSLLHKASGAFGATIEHVKLLVRRSADLDLPDMLGETPLLSAIVTNQPSRAMYLLDRGAKVEVYTVNGMTRALAVQPAIDDQPPGSPMQRELEHLRDRTIVHVAKFPPDPPEKVRA